MKPYTVIFSFYEPIEGDITILAENEEDAKKTVIELFNKRKDVNVIQVFEKTDEVVDQLQFPLLPQEIN